MNCPFTGKVALVTGGASGIGKAVVKRFAKHGAAVVVADNSPVGYELSKACRQLGQRVEFTMADVRNTLDLTKAVDLAQDRFGGLDILVNSAGIFPRGTLEETTDDLWDRIMDINLKGVYHACRAVVPALIDQGGGVIINIGSLNAFGGTPDLFAYSTSKGAVTTLTMNLARALAKHGIRVNCVHPGWVVTEGEMDIQLQAGQPENWMVTGASKIPLGRLQTPDDIASCVLFLASDDACQITGQSLAVDGGLRFEY
ncbi:SDR family NAD(P)-dependent oxidoreductase [Alicyclobacillus dauci]|uniref:SDR family oxidoreductase n=1 Tax=Alicyclobacillus dauci TaxID=1475485 RepID=A0ABY6YZA7_9BACL|nr:SDR family oxidoreductase [Alicyclobacillus dauci]WAH35306.1 SDR family oxidoreductase [Alicyclobacillus dauci]